MDYIKLLEMMVKVQMDDLTDADMLIDYAKKAEIAGSMEMYQKFAARAKARIQSYDSCTAEIDSIVQRMKSENPAAEEKAVLYDIQSMYVNDWKERIKDRLAVM